MWDVISSQGWGRDDGCPASWGHLLSGEALGGGTAIRTRDGEAAQAEWKPVLLWLGACRPSDRTCGKREMFVACFPYTRGLLMVPTAEAGRTLLS